MFVIRPAVLEEAIIIGAQRRAMFFDMGYRDGLDTMVESFLPWIRGKMTAGEYLGWFAVAENGAIAAGAGLWLMDWPPHMIGPGSRRGNILKWSRAVEPCSDCQISLSGTCRVRHSA